VEKLRKQVILIIAILAYTLSIVGSAAADNPGTIDNSSSIITDNSTNTEPGNITNDSSTCNGTTDPTNGGTGTVTTTTDPTTGDLIDPTTGDLIDPTTGDLIDPTTGDLIDPTTGDLIDPTTGDLIDPTTGDLINSTYSNSTDPVITDPIISNPIFGNGSTGILPVYMLANAEGGNGLSNLQQDTNSTVITHNSEALLDTSNSSVNNQNDPIIVSDQINNTDPASDNVTTNFSTQNNTNNTVPMQNTGGPLIPFALSTLMMMGGVVAAKIRKY
jgi:hypothetical protein